jgi:Putative peptidoglycan binding domain
MRTRSRFGIRFLVVVGVMAASIVVAVPASAQAATPTCTDFSRASGRGGVEVVVAVSSGSSPFCIASPSRGTRPAIRTIQQTLNACYGHDGIYGPRTQRGVRIAQQLAGVTADGVYGPQTAVAIRHRVFGSFSGRIGWSSRHTRSTRAQP